MGDASSIKKDLPFLGAVEPAHHIEEAGFPGTIRTDDGQDFSFFNFKIEGGECLEFPEGQVDVLCPKQYGILAFFAIGIKQGAFLSNTFSQ